MDDEANLRAMLRAYLEQEGCRVVEAADGRAALYVARVMAAPVGSDVASVEARLVHIKTLAPRVALLAIPRGDGNTRIVCLATDYNLDESTFSCPAPRASWERGYQAAPWFQEL